MSDEAAAKIRGLSQSDIPIQERRALYNSLRRRVESGVNLKPGLVEKYNAVGQSRKERWTLLKEFLVDPNMRKPQT